MQKFIKLSGRAAPLPIDNVDTDMIIPKQFLKTIKRTGLSEGLFFEMRYDEKGNKIENFILHQPDYEKSAIVISGDNFGCGSSREHAPWALLDYGIRCVIAESFADIFYNNCFKNGILPLPLPKETVKQIMEYAQDHENQITVDLEAQQIVFDNRIVKFEIDPFRKHCLLNGLDDIGLSLQKSDAIASFETKNKSDKPWLFA